MDKAKAKLPKEANQKKLALECDHFEIHCPICGDKLVWMSDFDFEDFQLEGDGVVHELTCPNGCCDLCTYESCNGEWPIKR